MQYQRINVHTITKLHKTFPDEFVSFCLENKLKPPNITKSGGKALSAMLHYPNHYWDRESCDEFVTKFNIQTKDSIQLFNKHAQWGIKTNSGIEKGKLYIIHPYCLSNKHKMRKSFKFDGTDEERNTEITKIKSTIQADYTEIPNTSWQLGHKNPGSVDNTQANLILQPPIQAKYKDDYLFFDTLTKMPLPKKLNRMIEQKEIELTHEQIHNYLELFQKLTVKFDVTPS
jgi:hypothetical protein